MNKITTGYEYPSGKPITMDETEVIKKDRKKFINKFLKAYCKYNNIKLKKISGLSRLEYCLFEKLYTRDGLGLGPLIAETQAMVKRNLKRLKK